MSRRRSPRPAATALRRALEGAAPKTPLAAVQSVWEEAVGERVAAAAQPLSERAGVVKVVCADSVWTEELDLMRERLEQRLAERLGEAAPKRLQFRVKDVDG